VKVKQNPARGAGWGNESDNKHTLGFTNFHVFPFLSGISNVFHKCK